MALVIDAKQYIELSRAVCGGIVTLETLEKKLGVTIIMRR